MTPETPVRLGGNGPEVGPIGLGCMGMSWGYAEGRRDDAASVKLIQEALDLGVTLVDTADVYGDGHNESLVGQALVGRREKAVLATKCGLVVDDLATKAMHRNGTAEHLRAAVESSLRRLGTDVIDLYYLHRVDPEVDLAESWGALADLVTAGKVRYLGLSEVTVEQAEQAHRQHPVSAIQSELSLWTRQPLGIVAASEVVSGEQAGGAPAGGTPQDAPGDVVSWCAAHDCTFVPYAPLGRGFLTGAYTDRNQLEATDVRKGHSRFAEEALAANLRIVDVIRTVARRHDATPAQIAIAWTMTRGEHVVPIPGTKTRDHLWENLGAARLRLTAADLQDLDAVPAAVGARF